MGESAPQLKLVSTQPESWDPVRFIRRICDGGLLAEIKPAEVKVLVQAYRMADRHGEVDLPQTFLADHLGYTTRAVRESINSLEGRGVIQRVGASRVAAGVIRFRVLMPPQSEHERQDQAPPSIAASASGSSSREPIAPPQSGCDHRAGAGEIAASSPAPRARPDNQAPPTPPTPPARKLPGNSTDPRNTASPPEATFRPPGSYVPKPRKPASPKECFKERVKECSSKDGSGARSPGGGSLFEPAPYDAAAAAALRVWLGLPARVAHGIVSQHRPSRRQVLIVLANAFAWRRAERLGELAGSPHLRNLVGFVRSSIAEGNWLADDRLIRYRERVRKRAADRRRQAEVERQARELEAEAVARLIPSAQRRIEQMPPEQRQHTIRQLARELARERGVDR